MTSRGRFNVLCSEISTGTLPKLFILQIAKNCLSDLVVSGDHQVTSLYFELHEMKQL